MSATAHTAWLDAWEGASTPSPRTYRTASPRGRSLRPAAPRPLSSYSTSVRSVTSFEAGGHQGYTRGPSAAPARAVRDYDWEAAARRRPALNECERVILHTDRTVAARLSSARYYGKEATARRPEPWPEARRREAIPQLKAMRRKVPQWRLGVLVGVFAALLIGLTVIAPIMTSSAVASLESAVGQAETQQQQLSADTAELSSQISSLSSPARVAEQAAELGLGPADDVSYLATGDQMLASEGDTTVAGR